MICDYYICIYCFMVIGYLIGKVVETYWKYLKVKLNEEDK